MKTRLVLVFAALFSAAFHVQVFAQGTAFTYQGRLNDGASPANGIYDLRFETYDAPSGGSGQGRAVTNSAVSVSNGLFTVTLDFGAGVFNGPNPWLDISVRPSGPGAFTSLAPRQLITATPYAIRAGNVTGPINGALITAGTITITQLAPGAAVSNLNAAGQSGVASGGLVLSATENAALANAGYVKIGTTTTGDTWQQRGNGTPPNIRRSHTAVWTGSEIIVWGGKNSTTFLLSGGRYSPRTNNWAGVNTFGAPARRARHTAVWTGTRMIVWGGENDNGYLNDGGSYNPLGNNWTEINSIAPVARVGHTAVWTGTQMIIWGGFTVGISNVTLNEGGRYNPTTDTWAEVNPNGAPGMRTEHVAVWTGNEMIVWGGWSSGSTDLHTGGRYNPLANTWAPMNTNGAPLGRREFTAVWTGTEMIVWGGGDGVNGGTISLQTGGRYNPVTDSWTPTTLTGAPSYRLDHTAVWAGDQMIVWGGGWDSGGTEIDDSASYHPSSNFWTPTSMSGAPGKRRHHTATWTGSEMIVWGGVSYTNFFNDTFSYSPGRVLHLYQSP